MRCRSLSMLLAIVFALSFFGCEQVKELTGQGEEKKEEKKVEEPSAGAGEAQAAAEKAKEEAEKAAEEAKLQAAEAKAEAEKAKAETEKAKEETEKTKLDAEEDKAKTEERAVRKALTRELAMFTAELASMHNSLAGAQEAWGRAGITEKAEAMTGLLKEMEPIEAERNTVEGLMVQGKLDEARTKLEVLKAKFPPVKQKADPLLAEKPTDPAKWAAMMKILAAETCLVKKNLPAQEFNANREALFARFGLDRLTYEQLRAEYNKSQRPADQAALGKLVSELCPEGAAAAEGGGAAGTEGGEAAGAEGGEAAGTEGGEGDAAVEKKDDAVVEKKEDDAVEKKEEKKDTALSGKFSGTLLAAGKKGKISLVVKSNKVTGGQVNLSGVKMNLKGKLGSGKSISGKSGKSQIKCSGKKIASGVSGVCQGSLNGKAFKNARYTARGK